MNVWRRKYKQLKFCTAACTMAIFCLHFFLSVKRVELYPSANVNTEFSEFSRDGLVTSATWQDDQKKAWQCDLQLMASQSCAWEIHWSNEHNLSMDLTGYDAIELVIRYQGSATKARLFMRNSSGAAVGKNGEIADRPMSSVIHTLRFNRPLVVPLSDFTVPLWWLSQPLVGSSGVLAEFNRITSLGIEFIEPGKHQVQVDQVTLLGRWVRTRDLALAILTLWMVVLLAEGCVEIYQLLQVRAQKRYKIRKKRYLQISMERERSRITDFSDKDSLTGFYNRKGVTKQFDGFQKNLMHGNSLGLMLLDMDHFTAVNAQYGHDMGDRVLKMFSAILGANLRGSDLLGRWGGEEFVLICPIKSKRGLLKFAEKIRSVVAQSVFAGDQNLNITVSIGATKITQEEHLDSAVERARKALQMAKSDGRNRVLYEGDE